MRIVNTICSLRNFSAELALVVFVLSFTTTYAQRMIIFEENWKDGIGKWGVSNGLWEVGVPTVGPDSSFSPPNCAGTVLGGTYPNGANTRLESPVSPQILLPHLSSGEKIQLKFWHWFANSDDHGVVEISVNGGKWKPISSDSFTGPSIVWTQYVADLSTFADSTIRIGFLFTSNNGFFDVGWYIDDIIIEKKVVPSPFDNIDRTEKFDDGVGDWSTNNGLWEVGVPTAGPDSCFSPPNCAGTVLGGTYPNAHRTCFISPEVTLNPLVGEIPVLFFWHWFSLSNDRGDVLISVNGGPFQTIAGPFTGSSLVWTPAPPTDLSAFADSTVRIAFCLTSTSGFFDVGWYIDDIRIEGITTNNCFTSSTKAINFHDILINATSTKQVTVTNCGTTTLDMSINITGQDSAYFGVEPEVLTLEAGENGNLDVRFTPDKERTFTATLEIDSDAGNLSVPLTGNGIGDMCPAPFITSITDVPNDQGKQVTIIWNRACPDTAGSEQPIRFYGVWRRADQVPKTSTHTPTIQALDSFEDMMAAAHNATPGTNYSIKRSTLSSANEIWTFVGAAPALQFQQYAFDAPTLFDSTDATGIIWSVFFISAHTDDALVWYASEPDSGYSVDNLAPTAPSGLFAAEIKNGVELQWNPNSDEDFKHFSIYRDVVEDFELTEPFAFSVDTAFTDSSVEVGINYYYKVTAADFSGNESNPSNEVNIVVTSVGNSPNVPTEFALEQNYPNPFNPETTIRYQLPEAGHVGLVIYSMLGEKVRSLINEEKAAGNYQVRWDGTNDSGKQVASGIYLYELKSGEFVQTRKMLLIR